VRNWINAFFFELAKTEVRWRRLTRLNVRLSVRPSVCKGANRTTYVMGCLHDEANMKQTSSTRRARVFSIQLLYVYFLMQTGYNLYVSR